MSTPALLETNYCRQDYQMKAAPAEGCWRIFRGAEIESHCNIIRAREKYEFSSFGTHSFPSASFNDAALLALPAKEGSVGVRYGEGGNRSGSMDFLGLPRDEKVGEELGVEAPARTLGEASSSLVGDPPNNLTCVTGMRTSRLWHGAKN